MDRSLEPHGSPEPSSGRRSINGDWLSRHFGIVAVDVVAVSSWPKSSACRRVLAIDFDGARVSGRFSMASSSSISNQRVPFCCNGCRCLLFFSSPAHFHFHFHCDERHVFHGARRCFFLFFFLNWQSSIDWRNRCAATFGPSGGVATALYRILMYSNRFLPVFTGFYEVSAGLNLVLTSATGFYLVLPSFTGFYRVLLGFTGFYWVLPGFTWIYEVSVGLNLVLTSATGFYLVLPSFA